MNILDENMLASQRQMLKSWRVRAKQIGKDVGYQGMKDQNQVIPLLHSLRQPILFTHDMGFYHRRFCHKRYGLVCLAVDLEEAASFIRRFLRHPAFDTKAKRMGKVACVSLEGIRLWGLGEDEELRVAWKNR
jgi:hypothetical protein